jgi:hypothetical protein
VTEEPFVMTLFSTATRRHPSRWDSIITIGLLLLALLPLKPADLCAVEPSGLENFPQELIDSDVQALLEQSTYKGLPPLPPNADPGATTDGGALLVVRTTLRGIDPERLDRLAGHVASSAHIPGLKLTTLSDLNATSKEAKRGTSSSGQVLDFNENQTVVNAAIAHGLGLVLFVDLMHFNSKRSTVSGAEKLSVLNARASLTLLNAADGVRVKSANREVNARGFDAANLEDKAFDVLARDLTGEVNGWRIPAVQIKLIELEVHAKMDGISFPIMDFSTEVDQIRVSEVPVFAEDASVEIDGILRGKAPCRIAVTRGTHKLRVYREGTQAFTAVIQVNESNRYDALLVPTPEFRKRFDEQTVKFEQIKALVLKRKVELEAAGARVESIRVGNANSRDVGRAGADLIQSRADVSRQTSEANADLIRSRAAAVASEAAAKSQVAVIDAESRAKLADGSAAILQEKAKGELVRTNADAALKMARADAVRQGAEGQLAIDKATAKNVGAIMKVRNEMLQAQVDAFRSFAEKLGGFAFRIGGPQRP